MTIISAPDEATSSTSGYGLLDAFLVRLTLLPVLLRLCGRAAWYSPSWLKRIVPKVTFLHG
jgi:putative drug exporter of the RND superfamily